MARKSLFRSEKGIFQPSGFAFAVTEKAFRCEEGHVMEHGVFCFAKMFCQYFLPSETYIYATARRFSGIFSRAFVMFIRNLSLFLSDLYDKRKNFKLKPKKLKIMKKIAFLAVLAVIASCGNKPVKQAERKTLKESSFLGDFVTEEYAQRAEGNDWTAVSITETSDSTAHISIRSRADIKKPSCTFDGDGILTPDGDSLVVETEGNHIYFTLRDDTLGISSDDDTILYYYCSGGGTLKGDYVRLHEPLDNRQLKEDVKKAE